MRKRYIVWFLALIVALGATGVTSCTSTRAYWGVDGRYDSNYYHHHGHGPNRPHHHDDGHHKKHKKHKKHDKHRHHHDD